MSIAVFVCGPAGAGKSTLAKSLVPMLNRLSRDPFCLLDKDTMTDPLSEALMHSLTGSSLDRDSAAYKVHVRGREYASVLHTARENLELGINAVMPGPWTREIADGSLFHAPSLGFELNTKTLVIWLDLPEPERLARIQSRKNPRDAYKLKNWSAYAQALPAWGAKPPKGMLVLDATLSEETLLTSVVQALKPNL